MNMDWCSIFHLWKTMIDTTKVMGALLMKWQRKLKKPNPSMMS